MNTIYRFDGKLLSGAKLNKAVKDASVAKFGKPAIQEAMERRHKGEKRPLRDILADIIYKELGVEELGQLNPK